MRISRRELIAGAGTIAASVASSEAFAAWAPTESYPDPALISVDPAFDKYKRFSAGVERLYQGTRWGEGPVYVGDGRYLIWSDIPNNRELRWDEQTGEVTVHRQPSGHANGHTRDRQGRLLSCEHSGRRVIRTEHDGTITIIADSFEGKRLNSPNDVVVSSDGSIWFSDPPYGFNDYTGDAGVAELPNNVYRIDGKTGKMTVAANDFAAPNGLCFSPDEKKMYILDTSAKPAVFRVYDVVDDLGKLANGRAFYTCEAGHTSDGFRCDTDGNLWCAWAGSEAQNGVVVISPDGKLIGRIKLPDVGINLCFGGVKRNRLFVVTGHGLFAVYTNAKGAIGG